MVSDFKSAYEIRKGIQNKCFSAREIAEKCFMTIKEKDPAVNAFLTLCEERAYLQAEAVDKKIKNGQSAGRLAGVPVAVKDNICTEGIKTTCASKMLEDFVPPYDATVIDKLCSEGALIIGKTNMDEFAMGSSTENSAFKITHNPRDLSRVPGGSSGGSAAAVACSMVPLSLGSDTGGSIRQPAAFCGVVGLKPTYGLVSRYGLIAFGSSLDQIGPLAKTIKDAALLLEVIQGNDARDSTSYRGAYQDHYLETIEPFVKGLKIGIPVEFFKEGLDEEISAAVKEAVKVFEAMGAQIEEVNFPIADEGLSAYYIISSAEASSNLARYDGIRYGYRKGEFTSLDELIEGSRSEAFGPEVKRRIMLGTYALSSGYYDEYYNRAQKFRKVLRDSFSKLFSRYDIILGPTSPVLPFKVGERSIDPLKMYLADIYTVNINLAGLPAISMPCGLSGGGLPVGLQLIGSHFNEDKLLKAAYSLEQALQLKI